MKLLLDIVLLLSLFSTGRSWSGVAKYKDVDEGKFSLRSGARRLDDECDSISKFTSAELQLD